MLTVIETNEDFRVASSIEVQGLTPYFEKVSISKDPVVVRAATQKYAQYIRTRLEATSKEFPGLSLTVKPATIALSEGKDIDAVGLVRFVSDIRSAAFDTFYGKYLATFTARHPNLNADHATFMKDVVPAATSDHSSAHVQAQITRKRSKAKLIVAIRSRSLVRRSRTASSLR